MDYDNILNYMIRIYIPSSTYTYTLDFPVSLQRFNLLKTQVTTKYNITDIAYSSGTIVNEDELDINKGKTLKYSSEIYEIESDGSWSPQVEFMVIDTGLCLSTPKLESKESIQQTY